MGGVYAMRTPPIPSPAEAPLPATASPSHTRRPSQSILPCLRPDTSDAYTAVDGFATVENNRLTPNVDPSSMGSKDNDANTGNQDDQGRSMQTLKELRRQMEELLVYQQKRQAQNQYSVTDSRDDCLSSRPDTASANTTGFTNKPRKSKTSSPSFIPSFPGPLPSATHSDSTGSGGTIRAMDSSKSPGQMVGQTPSYPFPKMKPQTTASVTVTQERGPHRTNFKLTFPAEKLKVQMATPQGTDDPPSSTAETPTAHSIFLPTDAKPVIEDPIYPSPNLYDVALKLNAEPGLDAWWSNVVSILQTCYGAERASLAVPGDSTDLENVPWGQKAVFNQHVTEDDRLPAQEPLEQAFFVGGSTFADDVKPGGKKDVSAAGLDTKGSKRPSLLSRHTFAGFGNDGEHSTLRDPNRLQHPSKLKDSIKPEAKHGRMSSDEITSKDTKHSVNQEHSTQPPNVSSSPEQNHRQAVFPIPRPLEVEADPLIKRTGVVKLFGRTKPVILTREYSYDPVTTSDSGEADVPTLDDKVQITPTAEPPLVTKPTLLSTRAARSKSTSTLNAPIFQPRKTGSMEFYDEYEQIPPSPWSQSPAPSPAPRAHADQNPFFASHAVDEGAFAKNPPPHDYSNTEPLEAIGVDMAKSVVHIPLLHAGPSKQTSPSTLRFPVAIISMLSPIIPYPSNLRQSLAYLMPHLTTSFGLAQQYSQLERQVASRMEAPRYGHLLGLGGTFSDEGSELELVAGLSGHVNSGLADDGSLSARASLSSPGEGSTSTKYSPSISTLGTPGIDLSNLASGTAVNPSASPGAAAKNTTDAADSYFNVHQTKIFREAIGRHRSRLPKSKHTLASSTPTSPGNFWGKHFAEDDPVSQDPGLVVASPSQETRTSAVISPTQASSRHPSTNSIYAHLQRELPRPFPDTVAQLMLNSVPLHLFLAKPQSGEVIWTNTKFDSYRRSQPQEQKLRDPWQNIHSSEREHVSQEWENALRTGSQFTERVRVKRFNDESAYRWFIFRANPLLSSTGEVLYWIGSFLDIHEQHIAELKATQEREKFAIDAKYRAFSNSIPQVVFEAAEYRGLIFVNEQWHLYTGQKLEEALHLGFAKHVHPDDIEKCGLLSLQMAELESVMRASEPNDSSGDSVKGKLNSPEIDFGRGVTPALDELVRRGVVSVQKDENGRVFYSTEIRLRSRGGDFRWHLVRLVKVETSSFGTGEASWYGTCTDINDRKLLERELNKAMHQLNKEMESKTKFFSNMSHEIRTPLNGILGTIPFILDTQLDTDQRRMLDTIQNSSTNLRELVDNILDVSRVEAGKMTFVHSWFHVRSVIEDVIDTVASRAIDKGLEINYLMDVDVPSMVIGDRFRIRQVLINLVGNAVKFTAQGEIYTRCSIYRDPSITLKPTEILLHFEVVDTGKGFSSRDAERLMQRFSQIGENSSQQHAGSGLGLFLSKQLVEMHGGKLTPSSREGQGAKFSFYVRVDAPPPPTPEEPRLVRQASSASDTLGTLSQSSSLQRMPISSKELGDLRGLMSDLSPGLDSPLFQPSAGSDPSTRSMFNNLAERSSSPSALATPELHAVDPLVKIDPPKSSPNLSEVSGHTRLSSATSSSNDTVRPVARSNSSFSQDPSPPLRIGPSGSNSDAPTHSSYSILILSPLDNTREAIKQHIEQVVPHEVPFEILSLPDVDDWKDLVNSKSCPDITHLVLNLAGVDDVMDAIEYVSQLDSHVASTLVIISDLYQKKRINDKIKELVSTGRQVYSVPKPVKPSAFSTIFDPNNRRDLSKDRNQDMAREINNNFKTMSKMVKEVIGNKGYRILLVEDDETNRMVMLKYLDKIKVISETAANGQECTEMVFSKEPGYYSLIICDIQMPVKNGYQTCREIREWEQKNHYPQIPIMALSANAMTDQIENAARAGFNDYVTKPIKHTELGKMMMGLLDPNRPLVLLRDRLSPQDPRDHGQA